ncbi:unnamed protein product [Prunus brigantina]
MPPRKKTRSNNMTSQDGPSHADSESRQHASSREEERASEGTFALTDLVAAIHVMATNKTLLRILSKIVYEYEGGWSVHLPDALWAYRTSSRSATGFSPYSLVYGSDAISPWRLLDLEALDEKRAEAERRTTLYHRTVAQAYNRTVKPRAFKQGDLVLKVVEHVRRQMLGPSKFAPQWEGLFAVKEVYNRGYYHLVSVKEGTLTDPVNGKWLKSYYC